MALVDEIKQHMLNSRTKLDSARSDQTNAINKLNLLIPQIAEKDTTIAEQLALLDMQRELIKSYEITNAELKAKLEACEAGNEPPPPPPPPPSDEFVWAGANSNWNAIKASAGPRVPDSEIIDAPGGVMGGLIQKKRFTSTVIPLAGAVFEDCIFAVAGGWDIDGDGRGQFTVRYSRFEKGTGYASVLGNAILEYVEMRDGEDGFKPQGSDWVLRRSWIHDLVKGGHNDGVQAFEGPGLIEENVIEATDTSEVMVQSWDNSAANAPRGVIVRRNWLGGSDLPLRIEAECKGKGCQAIENVIVRGAWGHFDLSGADVHYGNIDAAGNPID